MKNLLDISEAAQRLGVSIHTLRGWVSQRRIKFVKLGGRRVLFREEDLDELVDRSVVEPRERKAP
jgi:excisionase family DNA binding protein